MAVPRIELGIPACLNYNTFVYVSYESSALPLSYTADRRNIGWFLRVLVLAILIKLFFLERVWL